MIAAAQRILREPAFGLALLLLALSPFNAVPAAAQTRYTPPEGCTALATLRLPNCIVNHVSSCESGNISDMFSDGRLFGRAFYGHASLFKQFVRVDGMVSGHDYGPGAPGQGDVLREGDRYQYSRKVYRSEGAAEPGDEGIEVMEVGSLASIDLDGRTYQVRDIRFEVTNDDGFRYEERALMLDNPRLTIGALSREFAADGSVADTHTSLPESISLPGDLDFLGFDPARSCLQAL